MTSKPVTTSYVLVEGRADDGYTFFDAPSVLDAFDHPIFRERKLVTSVITNHAHIMIKITLWNSQRPQKVYLELQMVENAQNDVVDFLSNLFAVHSPT